MKKLSPTEELILGLLIGRKTEMYGMQIVEESRGVIARGSVYVLLDRMEDKRLVRSWKELKDPGESGIARRMYQPTGHGARVYREAVARRARVVGFPVPEFSM